MLRITDKKLHLSSVRHFVTLAIRECKSFMQDVSLVRSEKAIPKTLQATGDYDRILKELGKGSSAS